MAGEKLVRRALQAVREATKPLPMDEASRMARAQSQGFTVDAFKGAYPYDPMTGPVYGFKGGKWRPVERVGEEEKLLTHFDTPDKPYAGFFGGEEVANRFAKAYGEKGSVFPVKLKFENPVEIDAAGRPAAAFQFEPIAREHGAIEDYLRFRSAFDEPSNYDGVIIKNTADEGTIYIPRTPQQVRSRFAEFDPEKITSKDLLAGGAGVGAVGAAMEAGDMAQQGAEEPRERFQKGGIISRALKVARETLSPEELLMGIHNTDAGRKLEMIERLGGLPAPSIAVTKPSQGYTAFGDVSLVAPVEMVTPGRKTPAFGSDVYSPRFPSVEDDQIFRGFTPSGKRRYAPVTMENVLREMKGPIRGGESWNYGPASVRAQVTPQFKSLAEMQAAREKIIPASEFQAQKDASTEMMERLRERFEPYFKPNDPYRQSWSAFPEVMTDYARTGRPSEFAYDYKDLPAEALTEARSFLGHLRDMPTEYFEVKPQRGVPLSEFAGAVVPGDVPGEVVDRLRRLGVGRIEEYGDDASRRDALMKFVGEQGFAEGGEVSEGHIEHALRLIQDQYPTQYLPNVGRQVMQDGGMPDFPFLDADRVYTPEEEAIRNAPYITPTQKMDVMETYLGDVADQRLHRELPSQAATDPEVQSYLQSFAPPQTGAGLEKPAAPELPPGEYGRQKLDRIINNLVSPGVREGLSAARRAITSGADTGLPPGEFGRQRLDTILNNLVTPALRGSQATMGAEDIRGGTAFPDRQGVPLLPTDYRMGPAKQPTAPGSDVAPVVPEPAPAPAPVQIPAPAPIATIMNAPSTVPAPTPPVAAPAVRSPYGNFTDADVEALANMIAGEASTQGREGMAQVGQVAINRALMNYNNYGDTLQAQLSRPRQFLGYNSRNANQIMSGQTPQQRAAAAQAREIARGLLEGTVQARYADATDFNRASTAYNRRRGAANAERLGAHTFFNASPAYARRLERARRARLDQREGRADGGIVDEALDIVREEPTAQARRRATIAAIQPDAPEISPEERGRMFRQAVENYSRFPVRPGEATLSSYDQTPRERFGQMLAGDEGEQTPGGRLRSRLARAAVGTTGLEGSGMGFGVADLPMATGIPLLAADVAGSASRGDYGEAALGATLPAAFYARRPLMEAGRRAVDVARDVMGRVPAPIAAGAAGAAAMTPEEAEAGKLDAIRRGLEAVRGIRAYHGSPHDFERFDISKIGTGEGAQAYGHGLYFADKEDAARFYRDQLSKRAFDVKKIADPYLAYSDEDAIRKIGHAIHQAEFLGEKSIAADYKAAQDWFKAGRPENFSSGRMYEVNIRANPEQLLDWDKPLREQPEGVRERVKKAYTFGPDYSFGAERTSSGFHPRVETPEGQKIFRDVILPSREEATLSGQERLLERLMRPKSAQESERLLEAGIPGIRYLDAGSCGAGEGSRNYVVFDDKLIDILRKYAQGGAAKELGSSPREPVTP